jgi:hypothetical protein
LAVGQIVTNYFSKGDWGLGTHVNTVTASGNSQATGQFTNKTDTATAILLPININCVLTLFSSFDMDENTNNDNHVTLPDSAPVELTVWTCNTNPFPVVATFSGLPCATNILGGPIVTSILLQPGQCFTNICDFDVVCPAGTNITVTVQATAVASTNVPCVFDANGNAITSRPSECEGVVICQRPVTCRVTGGGRMDFDVNDTNCIEIATTLFPTVVNGLELSHVTHGGQLGAPFAQMDCGAILGNPCIRGQWQHTRHYKGKGNPRDIIDMNFHSVTPKGQFDTLFCACLGCCDSEGTLIPGFVGPLHPNQKYALCNPDDRKVCGPQPRPAPANAIVFTGVGRIKPEDDGAGGASNKAAEYVVFRVYIEDRSEPGGKHPRGSVDPADIYCMQIWKTGIKISKKPDFTTVASAFRMALTQDSCAFLSALETGGLPLGSLPPPTVMGLTADIQDCGPLNRGNHQIHPATSATCTATPPPQ